MSMSPQNGAKYVATNLGHFTNTDRKTRVLLIDLDFENAFLCSHYLAESPHSIDDFVHIKDSIDTNLFLEKVTKTRLGFEVLKGSTMGKTDFIPAELIAKILIIARSIYTHVFVVISPDFLSPNTAMTLLHTDKLILVARNNYSNKNKALEVMAGIKPYVSDKEVGLIFNYKDHNSVLTLSYLKSLFSEDLKYLGSLDFDPGSVDNINLGENSMLKRANTNSREFKKIYKEFI